MKINFKTKFGNLTTEITYNKQEFKYVAYFIEKPEVQAKGTSIEEVLSKLDNKIMKQELI